jgi:hypothetical protein
MQETETVEGHNEDITEDRKVSQQPHDGGFIYIVILGKDVRISLRKVRIEQNRLLKSKPLEPNEGG